MYRFAWGVFTAAYVLAGIITFPYLGDLPNTTIAGLLMQAIIMFTGVTTLWHLAHNRRQLILRMLTRTRSSIAVAASMELRLEPDHQIRLYWTPTIAFFEALCDANLSYDEALGIFEPDRGAESERIAFRDTFDLFARQSLPPDHPDRILYRRVCTQSWWPVFDRFLKYRDRPEESDHRPAA